MILEPALEGRTRLDAGTWGTMGVGLGYAIAAASVSPERLVVAVEGDSAFGFSGMECETIARCAPCPCYCSVCGVGKVLMACLRRVSNMKGGTVQL